MQTNDEERTQGSRVGYRKCFEVGLGSLSKVGLPWLGPPGQKLHLSTKFEVGLF